MPEKSKTYEKSAPRVFIRTFGCQMNQHDSEIISGMLKERGFVFAVDMDNADIILFNTCSVRKHAEERVWGQLGVLNKRKAQNVKHKVIGVVGCTAQAYKEKILERFPHVDFVCSPMDIYNIPDLIEKVLEDHSKLISCSLKQRPIRQDRKFIARDGKVKAYVTISEGCNNLCSYCIVPYVRGKEKSKPSKMIIDEVRRLVDCGYKEVMLLGQNVNSYGKDLDEDIDFVKLLEMVDKTGINRVRFMTSHPKDANLDLFKAMRDLESICEHLHLPVQSGSDRILKLMNRGYCIADYTDLVDNLRKIIPGASITTDIIVGFPTETEEDFKKTYNLMEGIGFDNSYIFKYSPRDNTEASRLEDDVPIKIKQERNQTLLSLQNKNTFTKNKSLIGKTFEVLAEEKARKVPACASNPAYNFYLTGRTRTNKKTVFSSNMKNSIGSLTNIAIKDATCETLIGEVLR